MSDRIDHYLDGTLDRDALGPEERAEADAVARAVRDVRTFIDARPAPDVSTSVMHRIGHPTSAEALARAGIVARALRSLWMPRQVSMRPAYGMLVAAAVIALLLAPPPSMLRTRTDTPAALPAAAVSRLLVQFRLEADAASVQLAGSFTNWEPAYQLHQIAPSVWTVAVPLPQGVHDYAFVVDGRRWIADPYAPHISDGFGGTTSRLTLLHADAPRL